MIAHCQTDHLKDICHVAKFDHVHLSCHGDCRRLAGHVKFLDCGHHEVTKLDISDCSGNYCVIHKGKDLKMDGTFVANQDSQKVNMKITAKVNGLKMQVPGVESNACHIIKCPLVKGKSYDFNYGIFVPKLLPNVKADVTAELTGDHGLVACLTVKGKVTD